MERRGACVVPHRRGLLHNGHYRTPERINLRLEGCYCVGQRFCCCLFGCQKLENRLHIACRALLQSYTSPAISIAFIPAADWFVCALAAVGAASPVSRWMIPNLDRTSFP